MKGESKGKVKLRVR